VSIEFSTRESDGMMIVDLKGRIALGEGSVTVRETVHDLLSKGQRRILLNLGDVNYSDSSGLGELVSAFTAAKKQGGELKLLNLTKKVRKLLQITKLYTVFEVKDDEALAVIEWHCRLPEEQFPPVETQHPLRRDSGSSGIPEKRRSTQ
jgi:anti-sigma B factor antagonist